MAKLIAVHDKCESLKLKRRQLPIVVDDNKIMVMQLGDSCECCELLGPIVDYTNGNGNGNGNQIDEKSDSFLHQYSMLTREELLSALMVPAKTLFTRLAQVVGCVGCRRSVERLFYQLKESGNPAMEPLVVTASGLLNVLMKISLHPKILEGLFAEHRGMSEIFSAIPKLKKSGRCVLHSMEGVRCRPGSQAWLDMWEGMTPKCKDTITLISSDQLLTTLDNYLRKHRFCHECKNKVHRAYNILVGNLTIDPAKEKGYVASLYAGIRKCSKKHIHVSSETDYLMHLITRAEPELQGRRERHAKTLEIAQEEVLTCVGLFLYERLQRVQTRLREEEQTWEILFHVGLDALRRNFELAVEEKQGFSKFDRLCEELQRQEIIEKAKKDKKKRKKNNKKKLEEEAKEEEANSCDDDQSCEDCENNQSSSLSPVGGKKILQIQIQLKPSLEDDVSPTEDDDELGPEWRVQGKPSAGNKPRILKTHSCHSKDTSHSNIREGSKSNSSLDTFETTLIHHSPHIYQNNNSCSDDMNGEHSHNDDMNLQNHTSEANGVGPESQHQTTNGNHKSHLSQSSPQHLSTECSASIDSLASRCSVCSRDGGYCSGSAHCSACSNNGSNGSSRDSSEVACGEGLCSHTEDVDHHHNDSHHSNRNRDDACHVDDHPLMSCNSETCHSDCPDTLNDDIECGKENVLHGKASSAQFTMSLQQMLDDSSGGEADEIPEAEVQAWRAKQGVVKQKRAELRQTLKQRFQQLCHRKSLFDTNGIDNGNGKIRPLILNGHLTGF